MTLNNTDIKNIFSAISYGVGKHGGFLTSLSETAIKADPDNFRILKPALLEIIEKYNLTEKCYLLFPMEESNV